MSGDMNIVGRLYRSHPRSRDLREKDGDRFDRYLGAMLATGVLYKIAVQRWASGPTRS